MTETTTIADIRSSQQGDENAFARVVRAHYSYAYTLAFRLVLDESDADDVVQEGFVRVWKNLDRFDPNTRFTTWLYRIVTNVSLDVIRARKRRPMITDREPDDIPMGETADAGNPEALTGNRDMIEHINVLRQICQIHRDWCSRFAISRILRSRRSVNARAFPAKASAPTSTTRESGFGNVSRGSTMCKGECHEL